eukprot:gb/GEZN01004152.1/.p1 GENE.gb/GEZN01004152.1/~~gb/GEZN01004152.1/.p1  ORF type:complete len:538 (-),score=35.67 gb/GEZN01004152.1/:402-1853(-)
MVGLYFLMPLTLAVVWNGYAVRRESILAQRKENRAKSLNAAYETLYFSLLLRAQNSPVKRSRSSPSKPSPAPVVGGLPFEKMHELFEELNVHFLRVAFIEEPVAQRLLEALDRHKHGLISRREFLRLCSVVIDGKRAVRKHRFQRLYCIRSHDNYYPKPKVTPEEERTWCCGRQSKPIVTYEAPKWMEDLEGWSWFNYFFHALEVVSLLAILMQVIATEGEEDYFARSIIISNTVLLSFFSTESLIRIIVHGRLYFKKPRYLFDLCILVACWVCVMSFVDPDSGYRPDALQYLLLARCLLLLRVFSNVRTTRVMMAALMKLLPKFLSAFSTLLAVFTFFGLLGVQIFGGKIAVGSPELAKSLYGQGNYYAISMNDFSAAFVTLFAVMVVNNWFVVVSGYAAVTSNLVARSFFIPFYVITVLIILNLTVAFIVTIFTQELQKQLNPTDIDDESDNDDESEVLEEEDAQSFAESECSENSMRLYA